MESDRIILGITGNIGSGKSTVTKFFEKWGAIRISADEISRYYTSKETPIKTNLIDLFGEKVFLENGEVDRKLIAQIVFKDKEKLNQLTQLIHPMVRIRTKEIINNSPKKSIIAWEVPLLFETNLNNECDYSITVFSEKEILLSRVRDRDKMTEEEFQNRLNNQMDVKDKLELSDYIIENNSNLIELENKSFEIFQKIKMIRGIS
jgi:dephospho-CoA kinase